MRNIVLKTTTIALATIMALPITAMADEKASRHSMGSGPNVWRVQINNLNAVEIEKSGDNDGRSELRYIQYRLHAGDQFHQSHVLAEELDNISRGGTSAGDSYEAADVGDTVIAPIDPVDGNGTQLWIHVREGADAGSGVPTLDFNFDIAARELDCARRRVCRRGDTGVLHARFQVDRPARRSNRCNSSNSYVLSFDNLDTNLATVQLDYRDDPSRLPGGLMIARVSGSPIAGPAADAAGTQMVLCIASTTR